MTAISFCLLYFIDRHIDEDDDLDEDHLFSLDFVHSKWVSFGGGFYGLAALITFFVIEILEVIDFLTAATDLDYFIEAISFSTLIAIFVESLKNMFTALTWFMYWPDIIDMGNGWVWLIMAYAGYQLGEYLSDHVTGKEGDEHTD